MHLSRLALEYIQEARPVGLVIDDPTVTAQAVAAARMYAAYGSIKSLLPAVDPDAPLEPVKPVSWIRAETEVSQSEWGVIRPLFVLYVERENALHLEASRGLGVDVFGRSTSEISADINQLEADLPRRAFMQPVFTV